MKFLVDESVEYSVVGYLRQAGFDALSVTEGSPSILDEDVLSLARKQKRILITNDKDFGELVYMHKLPHAGVILLRLSPEAAQSKISRLKLLLKRYADKIEGNFIVVTWDKVRIRKGSG